MSTEKTLFKEQYGNPILFTSMRKMSAKEDTKADSNFFVMSLYDSLIFRPLLHYNDK